MKKLAVLAAILTIGSGVALAGPAEDREALMKSFGRAMGGLGAVAKGDQAFDQAAVLASLTALNEQAQKFDAKALFPEGVTGEAASPKIWEDFAAFEAEVDRFKVDVAAVVAAPPADLEGLQASMGKIGAHCGTCHELYRVKR